MDGWREAGTDGLTRTYSPISQHAFGAGAAAIGAEAVEALDSWETGLPLTLVDVLQAC